MTAKTDRTNAKTGNHKLYLDIMKIIAAWLVIYNHTKAYHFFLNGPDPHQVPYMITSMITRFNVPLFFMVTGALLLGKRESIQVVFKKRILRFLVVIISFSALCFLVDPYKEGVLNALAENGYTFEAFIRSVLNQQLVTAYWYLYAYLGFLFMLPFLQRGVEGLTKQEMCVLIGLHVLLVSFVPLVNVALDMKEMERIAIAPSLQIPFAMEKAFFYPLAGYYLDQKLDISKVGKRHMLLMVLASALGVAVSCFCTLKEGERTGMFSQNYVQLFDYVLAFTVFIIIKRIVTSRPNNPAGFGRIIMAVSGVTLGIYLLDPVIKDLLYKPSFKDLETTGCVFIASVAWCFFSMLVGGIITAILRKTPVKKLL